MFTEFSRCNGRFHDKTNPRNSVYYILLKKELLLPSFLRKCGTESWKFFSGYESTKVRKYDFGRVNRLPLRPGPFTPLSIIFVVLSYGMRRNYFSCDSKRVRSSKKRGYEFLSRGPGGVRGHEKRNSYPALRTPPCSGWYHQNSILANSTKFRVLRCRHKEVGNTKMLTTFHTESYKFP